MLVKILSDLHLHPMHSHLRYVDHGEYACILAGDISEGMRGVNWAEANIPSHIKVLYVPGNHEYYGHDYLELQKNFNAYNASMSSHVQILDNHVVEFGGVTFAGTTLWTDFMLYNNTQSTLDWAGMLNDVNWIKYGNRTINANDIIRLNTEALDFLHHVEADVLITHYGPEFSEDHKWKGHPATPSFLTKIPYNLHKKFKVHVHGHTHSCFDYTTPYNTRVICNPKGYSFENIHFNEELVINI